MHWFRSRARFWSWLALCALAIQLVLSFGHVHLDHALPLSADASIIAAAPALDDPPIDPSAPHNLADDYCAVCALIHLAGSLTPAIAPSLPLPVSFGRSLPEAGAAYSLAAPHRSPSQARAPPVA